MMRQDSVALISRARIGRLACAYGGQPFVVPVSFVYDQNYLYAFSTQGQKIAWMRANPQVCVEMDEIVTNANWATVVMTGQYEELTDSKDHHEARQHAYDLLHTKPSWWEPGYVKTILDGVERPISEPIYFRILIATLTGHRMLPDKT